MEKTIKTFIGRGFNKATMYELSLFSNLAYKEEGYVRDYLLSRGYDYLKLIDNEKTKTRAYISASEDNIILFFRGTIEKENAKTNVDVIKTKAPSLGKKEKIHRGFWRAYKKIKDAILEELMVLLKEKDRKVWITGHSLGAALAGIAAFDIQKSYVKKNIEGSYLFGLPRFCNNKFARSYDRLLKRITFRIVNNNDMVPRVPPRSIGYSHIGALYYFNSKGELIKGISWWFYLIDRIKGKLNDAFDGNLDALEDHDMRIYSDLCFANI